MKKASILIMALCVTFLFSCINKKDMKYKEAGGFIYVSPSTEEWTETKDASILPGVSTYKEIRNTSVTSYISEKYNASILIEDIQTTAENPGESYNEYFDALYESMKKLGAVTQNKADEEKIKSRQLITQMDNNLISLKCIFYDEYETDALIIDMVFTKDNMKDMSSIIETLFNSVQYKKHN